MEEKHLNQKKVSKDKQIGLRVSSDDYEYLKNKNRPISESIQRLIKEDLKKEPEIKHVKPPQVKLSVTSPNKYDLLDCKIIGSEMQGGDARGMHHLDIKISHSPMHLLREKDANTKDIEKDIKDQKIKFKESDPDEFFHGLCGITQTSTLTWTKQKKIEFFCKFTVACTYRVNRATKTSRIQKYLTKRIDKDAYSFINQYIKTSIDMLQAPRMEKMLPSTYWQFSRMAKSK